MDRDENEDVNRNTLFLRRISDARWTLLAVFSVIGYAAFDGKLTISYAILASVFILVVTILVPRSRIRPALIRSGDRSRSIWPDTGMKIAVDAFPLPCVVADHKSIVRHANGAASDLFGPLLPGDPLAYRLRVPQVLAAFDSIVAGGSASAIEWREKVPSDRVLEARFSPVHLPTNQKRSKKRPDFVIIVFFDLTELHQLDRMRADFVANASHELRTPLASLTGFIETLQGPARNDEEARENFLAIMLEQSNRMGRLINDLLSLSRIEMKGHVRPGTPIDLRTIATHVLDAMTPVAADLAVALEMGSENDPEAVDPEGVQSRHADAGPMMVLGDHDELVQVFSNLVENALRYGASGGKVAFSMQPKPKSENGQDAYEISVRDWGPGIEPKHLPRLTERFYRADIEKSRSSKGTGLGLAIVKHIVNRHGGRLQIKSVLGEGATFSVTLPMAPEKNVTDQEEAVLPQELAHAVEALAQRNDGS